MPIVFSDVIVALALWWWTFFLSVLYTSLFVNTLCACVQVCAGVSLFVCVRACVRVCVRACVVSRCCSYYNYLGLVTRF